MRRHLLACALAAIATSVGVLTIPALAVAIAGLVMDDEQRAAAVAHWSTTGGLMLRIVIVCVLLVVAVLVGLLVANRRARALLEPLDELAVRAERFGSGDARIEALDCGIPELDRIADVLAHSADEFTRNLAAERDFAADASHQLRTPLTALLMRLEEIAATPDLEVAKEEARIGIDQVERLSRVVADLMARGRAASTSGAAVSLDSVLASLQREWQAAFASARRSIRVHGERGLQVRATPVALGQMLSTLIENALVHGAGTVDVAARRSGPSVVVAVGDEGPGIPASIAPHIFERAVSSTGSGLGLTLARDLAEANGGRLDLVSRKPATFALFLSAAN
jgi:signal transduction histidine kinase